MIRTRPKNRLLLLLSPSKTISNLTGEELFTWTFARNVFATVETKTASERAQFGQSSVNVTHEVNVHYSQDIHPSSRFLMADYTGALSAGVNNSTTTIPLTDAGVLGVDQARRVLVLKVDSELMEVDSISGNNVTVARGSFGSSAATHSNGAAAIVYRQLNVGGVYDPDGTRRELVCECLEVK